MPLISVVMSVYNEPLDWIEQSIDSILNQTYTDFEFIIINDNPERRDLVVFLTEQVDKDKRIKLHHNRENIGLTKSLNIGLRLAAGKYLARMDADDISMPERFAKQVDFMEKHPEVIVCGTNIQYIGEASPFTYSDWIYEDNLNIKAQMLFNSGFAHPSVIIRKSSLEDNNIEYDENYKQGQDYRLWEQLYDKGEFGNVMNKLLKYRQSKQQVSHISNFTQVNNGIIIRRRLCNNWLKRIGFKPLNLEAFSIDDLLKLELLINTLKKDFEFFEKFLKTFYFSRNKNKIKYLFLCIRYCHFYKFSFKDKLRYFAIIVGKKQPITW